MCINMVKQQRMLQNHQFTSHSKQNNESQNLPRKIKTDFQEAVTLLRTNVNGKRTQTWVGSSVHSAQRASDMKPPLLFSSTRAVSGNFNIWCFKETHHRVLAPLKWKPILKYSLVISSNQGRRCNVQHWLTTNNCKEQANKNFRTTKWLIITPSRVVPTLAIWDGKELHLLEACQLNKPTFTLAPEMWKIKPQGHLVHFVWAGIFPGVGSYSQKLSHQRTNSKLTH